MKRQIAAIEFGTSKIVTMIAQNSGLDRLDIIGSGTVPYDGYSEGDWLSLIHISTACRR